MCVMCTKEVNPETVRILTCDLRPGELIVTRQAGWKWRWEMGNGCVPSGRTIHKDPEEAESFV